MTIVKVVETWKNCDNSYDNWISKKCCYYQWQLLQQLEDKNPMSVNKWWQKSIEIEFWTMITMAMTIKSQRSAAISHGNWIFETMMATAKPIRLRKNLLYCQGIRSWKSEYKNHKNEIFNNGDNNLGNWMIKTCDNCQQQSTMAIVSTAAV